MYYDKDGNVLTAQEYYILINNAINYVVSVYDEVDMKNVAINTLYTDNKQLMLSELLALREKFLSENESLSEG